MYTYLVAGMNREARLEDAILDPTNEELSSRARPPKPADVATVVHDSAKPDPCSKERNREKGFWLKQQGRHTEYRSYVVLQRAPAGQVVARPRLRIPLDAGKARPRDDERSLGWPCLRNRFGRNHSHEVRLYCFGQAQWSWAAVISTRCQLVHNRVILCNDRHESSKFNTRCH